MKLRSGMVPFLLMACAVMLITSCGKTTYRYNNVAYDDSEAALAAQRKDIDSLVEKMDVSSTPVGGTAIMILPSETYISDNFIRWSGSMNEEQKMKVGKHMAVSLLNSYRAGGQGLEKSRLFDKVLYGTSDTPENVPFEEDVAIYVKAENRKPLWFMRKKKEPGVSVPIEPVSSSLPPVMRMNLWVKNVEKTVRTR